MAKFRGAILECQECGKEFKVPPSRKHKAKYCSKQCADRHRHDATRKEKIVLSCKRCGKKFLEHKCHAERRLFCSYECANKDMEERAGLIQKDSHFYNRTLWRKLRKEVLLRDSYSCTKCGHYAERYLHVHHKSIRRFGGSDEVDNLITLCNSCHRIVHHSGEECCATE